MIFPLRPGPLAPGVGIVAGWRITSYFGNRKDPLTGRAGNHGGMDLAFVGCAGQPMLAVTDGLVAQSWDGSAGPGRGGGWWTGLTGDDGRYWGYGHAAHFADPDGAGPATSYAGRRVTAGTVIAYVGTSGGSTGPHLHIATKRAWWAPYEDPYDRLMAAEVAGGRLVTVGADPIRMLQREEPDVLTQEDKDWLARIIRDAANQAVEATVTTGENTAGVTRGEGEGGRTTTINSTDNIAGVTRGEGEATRALMREIDAGNYVELEAVQANLAGVMRERQAAGTIPATVDVEALAAEVAGHLALTVKPTAT